MRRSPLKRASSLRRTAMKATRQTTGPSRDVVEAVLERDQHSCVVCGHNLHGTRGLDWSIQHRRPRRQGGDPRPETNLPANLVAVCGSGVTGCHGWIEDRRTEAGEMGLLLHANDIPAEHPVATWYGSVLLDDQAGVWPITGDAA